MMSVGLYIKLTYLCMYYFFVQIRYIMINGPIIHANNLTERNENEISLSMEKPLQSKTDMYNIETDMYNMRLHIQ